MKALSIRQPWAWAILYAGKRIENRTWSTNYRGPLLIHAARGMTSRELCEAEIFIGNLSDTPMLFPECLKRGGIVGKCELKTVIEPGTKIETVINAFSLADLKPPHPEHWWDQNQYGWVLDKVEPVPFHPCRGRQGLFEVELCH
jgi:hypothetical protein